MNEFNPEAGTLEEKRASIEKSIIEEGRRLLREDPQRWPAFLNNFWSRVIPESNRLFLTPRGKAKELGYWDKKHRGHFPDDEEEHSALWLDQTDKKYFETIDGTIEEMDSDGEIRKAIDKLCNVRGFEERRMAQRELEERLIPVFARLVALGYTRAELKG